MSAVRLQGTRKCCDTKVLWFVTTSDVKFKQYAAIFSELGFDLRWAKVRKALLVEPQVEPSQSSNAIKILVSHPLGRISAYMLRRNRVPFFLEDTMLEIEAFSRPGYTPGLPGADTKNWWHNLGAEGVLGLLNGSANRGARFRCQIGACFGPKQRVYETAELPGEISHEVRVSDAAEREVPRSNPFFFHSIFVPQGLANTLGELSGDDFARHDYRRLCAEKLVARLLNPKSTRASQ